jgi:WD40 repeat protein
LYENADTYVMAIDAQSGNVIWENVQKDCWVDGLAVPICDDATDLLLTTSESVFLLDLKTGEITMDCTTGDYIIDINLYTGSNDFALFTKSGELLYVRTDLKQVMDMSYKFECKTSNHSYINNSGYGIAVVPYNDNKMTVYTYEQGPNIKEIEQKVELPEVEIIIGEEAQQIAQSFHLEDANYVLELYYSPDGKYCFISYWDRRLVICDVEKKAVINIIEDAYSTELCIGTDSEGNTYLSGYYGVYVLNKDMKPVMWIEHAKDVDIENQKVYLNWINSNYEAPLYSLEDLLEIAEVYNG